MRGANVLRLDELRAALQTRLDPKDLDGIISMHLLESDARLSGATAELPAAAGAADWFVLIDATDIGAVPAAMSRFSGNTALKPLIVSSGIYRLMWDLARSDIGS